MFRRYLCFSCISFAIFYVPVLSGGVDELLTEGDAYYKKFDNAKAYIAYKKALDKDKNNFKAFKMVVSTLNNQGEDSVDKKKAETFFLHAKKQADILITKFPDKADAYLYAALVYGNLAKILTGKEKALAGVKVMKYANKCISINHESALAYVTLGVYYREVANLNFLSLRMAKAVTGEKHDYTLPLAEQTIKTGVKLAPDKIFAVYELAVTQEIMKKYKEAKKNYILVIKLPLWDHQDPDKKKKAARKLSELK